MKIELALQPKQKEALYKSLETPVLFYGGSKGGGKSYLVRAREIYRRLKYPGTKGLIVRKTYPELLSNHIRMFFTEYPMVRDWFNKAEKAIYWPNGSITEFSYLKSTDDVYTYQGREYEDISIDEITQHEEEVFKILRSSNRTTKDIKPTMLLTGNPGGIGHAWAKRIFIDRIFKLEENPDDFDFIQAKVYDNAALMKADPAYVKRLEDLPPDLRRAYLEGDWTIFAGQIFAEFRKDIHVIRPTLPKSGYPHFLGIDWGYSGKESHQGAFAALASALVKADYRDLHGDRQYFNRVITYKEWYGKFKTSEQWAEEIYSKRKYQKIVCDSSMFNPVSDGSRAITDRMKDKFEELNKGWWASFERGTRNRIGSIEALHNWMKLAPDGLPYWLITENCRHLIRTIPMMIYDSHNPEDMDTDTEDHLVDAARYLLSYIKYIPAHLGAVKPPRDERKVLPALVTKLDLDEFAKVKSKRSKDWRA